MPRRTRHCPSALQALLLNLPDLIVDEPSALHVATVGLALWEAVNNRLARLPDFGHRRGWRTLW